MANLTTSAITADFTTLADNAEAVTLTPQNPTASGISVAAALRRVLSRQDVVNLQTLGIEPDGLVWNLGVNQLAGTSPKAGDKITAGSEYYRVVTATKETLGTRWRCVCVKEVA